MNDHNFWDTIPEWLKHLADALSLVTTLGVLVQFLPVLSAFLSCVWLGIRIYESATVQRWLGKR